MVHISGTRREKFPVVPVADTAPELAYVLAQAAVAHFQRVTQEKDGGCPSIATVNLGVIGAFEQAKQAFNDAIAKTYEAERAKEYGPVLGDWQKPAPAIKSSAAPSFTLDDLLSNDFGDVGEGEQSHY